MFITALMFLFPADFSCFCTVIEIDRLVAARADINIITQKLSSLKYNRIIHDSAVLKYVAFNPVEKEIYHSIYPTREICLPISILFEQNLDMTMLRRALVVLEDEHGDKYSVYLLQSMVRKYGFHCTQKLINECSRYPVYKKMDLLILLNIAKAVSE